MAIYVGGSTVAASGSGITLNSGFAFNANGVGAIADLPGFNARNANGASGYLGWYSSTGTGWPLGQISWQSGLSGALFTCPIAGYYAVGYNGIHNGGSFTGSPATTYGYAAILQNDTIVYWNHWNVSSSNAWNNGGLCGVLNCAANDTIRMKVNQSPVPFAGASYGTQNLGLYPDTHHNVWCVLVG